MSSDITDLMITPFVRQLCRVGSVTLGCSIVIVGQPGRAQVIQDSTLSTRVHRNGHVFEITKGNRVGNNLFHSFSEFSLPTGTEALFRNRADISNIFGRVTGQNPSLIDGLIRANGHANLTLINPNGITFGANAQLDIGGSFLGSTANSLEFADGTTFSATSPQPDPLLTMSAPVGLQFGQSPSPIQVKGNGHNLTAALPIFSPFTRGDVAGLKVQHGQTLALVGGDVNLDGGTLSADSGRIEVGSVGNGRVSIRPASQGWRFGYDGIQDFQDITFRSEALADASGTGSGFIQLQGRNVAINGGSIVLVQTQGSQDAAGLQVKATESFTVRGTRPDGSLSGGLFTETINAGDGGDIRVSAPKVVVQNGASIFTGTFTDAASGDITVKAPDSLQVLGFSRVNPNRFSNISATTFGSGPAGDINVTTGQLLARNGGNIAAVTGGIGGTGTGGNVVINARDSIDLRGVTPGTLTPSQITAGTGGAGDAGSVTINTQRLMLRNGGRVDASTVASGDAGSVTINASESVEVSGRVPRSRNPSLIISSANILDPSLRALLRLPDAPSGAAGNLTVNTPQLTISDGGQVTVRNDGIGDAGTLKVQADSIILRDQGRLTASTISGQGGNIMLRTGSLFALQNSAISAEAGGSGRGGNVVITGSSPADVVVLLDNSDITANAFMGPGGNISINTRGLFPCATCDISASSDLGVDGVVRLMTPETDAAREGVNLLEQIIDPETVVVQACSSNQGVANSEFTITGRGGLPPRPNTPLTSEAMVSFEPPTDDSEASSSTVETAPTSVLPPPAQGLLISQQGKVSLTATPTQSESGSPQLTQPHCQTS